MRNVKEPPRHDTPVGRAFTLLLYEMGFPVHRIGALFDCNQGRVSEIVNAYNEADRKRLRATGGDQERPESA